MSQSILSDVVTQKFLLVFGRNYTLDESVKNEIIRLFSPYFNPLDSNQFSINYLLQCLKELLKTYNIKTITIRHIHIVLDSARNYFSYLVNNIPPYPFMYVVGEMDEKAPGYNNYFSRGLGLASETIKNGFNKHFNQLTYEAGSVETILNCLEYISQVLAMENDNYFDNLLNLLPSEVDRTKPRRFQLESKIMSVTTYFLKERDIKKLTYVSLLYAFLNNSYLPYIPELLNVQIYSTKGAILNFEQKEEMKGLSPGKDHRGNLISDIDDMILGYAENFEDILNFQGYNPDTDLDKVKIPKNYKLPNSLECCKNGWLLSINYLHRLGVSFPQECIDKAAGKGHKEVIEYLISIDSTFTADAIDNAVEGGYIDIIIYLLSLGGTFKNNIFNIAVEYGHTDVIKFLRSYITNTGIDFEYFNNINNQKIDNINNQSFDLAAKGGHLNTIKYLADIGIEPSDNGEGMLLEAAEAGHLNIVKYCVEERKFSPDHDAIAYAVKGDHLDIIKYLISRSSRNIIDTDAFNNAISNGNKEILNYLLSIVLPANAIYSKPDGNNEMKINQNFLDLSYFQSSGITGAASNGHLDMIKYVFSLVGTDKTYLVTSYAFNGAAEKGRLDIIEYLVALFPNKASDVINENAIDIAVSSGYIDIIKYLVKVAGPKFTSSAIRIAIFNNHLNILEYLLPLNPDIIGGSDYLGSIDLACGKGNLDILKYLIAFIGEKQINEDCIVTAANSGHLNILKYLLGEDLPFNKLPPPNLINEKVMQQAVADASTEGYIEIVKYLIDLGFSFSKSALITNNIDIIRYLISKGATFTHDTLVYAASKGNLDILKYLISIRDTHMILSHKSKMQGGDFSYYSSEIKLACRYGHLNVVKYLLSINGYKVPITAIDEAAYHGYLNIIKYLLNEQLSRRDYSFNFNNLSNLDKRTIRTCFTYNATDNAIASHNIILTKFLVSIGGKFSYSLIENLDDEDVILTAYLESVEKTSGIVEGEEYDV